jgi:hypothetical protein
MQNYNQQQANALNPPMLNEVSDDLPVQCSQTQMLHHLDDPETSHKQPF